MGGSKRQKVKKFLSPTRLVTPSPPAAAESALNDDDLMDDLMAQLDSKDEAAKSETATVVAEMQPDKVVEQAETAPKQDSKSRHKARQVCPSVPPCTSSIAADIAPFAGTESCCASPAVCTGR